MSDEPNNDEQPKPVEKAPSPPAESRRPTNASIQSKAKDQDQKDDQNKANGGDKNADNGNEKDEGKKEEGEKDEEQDELTWPMYIWQISRSIILFCVGCKTACEFTGCVLTPPLERIR